MRVLNFTVACSHQSASADGFALSCLIILILHLSVCLSVTSVRESGRSHFFPFIAGLGRYMRKSTDTAGNGTSRRLK